VYCRSIDWQNGRVDVSILVNLAWTHAGSPSSSNNASMEQSAATYRTFLTTGKFDADITFCRSKSAQPRVIDLRDGPGRSRCLSVCIAREGGGKCDVTR